MAKTNIALVNYEVDRTGFANGDTCTCQSSFWENLGITLLKSLVIIFLRVGVAILVVRGILKMREMYFAHAIKARALKEEKMAELRREVESAYAAQQSLVVQDDTRVVAMQDVFAAKAITRTVS